MKRPQLKKGLKVFKCGNELKLGILEESSDVNTIKTSYEARVARKHVNLKKRNVYIDLDLIRL